MKITRAALFLIAAMGILLVGGQDKKKGVEGLFDGYFREMLDRNPELATEIGVSRAMGYEPANDRLTDVSAAGMAREFAIARKYRALLDAVDPAGLEPSQRVPAALLRWMIEDALRGEKFWRHRYVIDHLNGAHGYLTNLMTELHPLRSPGDARDYCSRLEAYGRRYDQLLEILDFQQKSGIIPAKAVIERVARDMSDFTAAEPAGNILVTALADKLGRLDSISAEARKALVARAEAAVRTVVYPAYSRFLERLKPIALTATSDLGVWKLADGEAYYAWRLHSHTTTDLTAEEIHRLGLRETERIQKEMTAAIRSLGIPGGTTFAEILGLYRAHLQSRPPEKRSYPDTEEGKTRAVADYQAIIDKAMDGLPRFFSLFPKERVRAQRVPAFQEASYPSNYMPPSLDGTRKGVFSVNLARPPLRSNMKALTYHEAVPGHHFMYALERESADYRLFRYMAMFDGDLEGWALYSEQLADEFGWYADPYERLGWMTSDLGRAMRLVVDTGLHAKRWTRDQALRWQAENMGAPSPFEVDRYSVFPGQACAYMVGKLKILGWRTRAQTALGTKFDLREFHKVLLEHGSMPLDQLEKFVDGYIGAAGPVR